MSSRRSAVAFTLAFVAFVTTGLAVTDANAFCRTTTCKGKACKEDANGCDDKTPLKWPTSCVSLSLDRKRSRVIDASGIDIVVADVIWTWNNVDCGGGKHPSIKLTRTPDVSCGNDEYTQGGPNANVLHFRDDFWEGDKSNDTLATTNASFDAKGVIRDADISVNTANNRFALAKAEPGTYELRTVLLHEVGHFLGIAHSRKPDSIMNASVETGKGAAKTLSDDDIEAICTAYPPGEDRPCDPTPEGGFSTTCAGEEPESGSGAKACAVSAPSRSDGAAGWSVVLLGVIASGLIARRVRVQRRRRS